MNVFRLKSGNKSNGANSKASSIAESNNEDGARPFTSEPLLTPPSNYTPPSAPLVDEAQQEKLDKLRTYIQSIMLPEDHEYYASEKGFITDGTLKRYLRARKWDYEVSFNIADGVFRGRRF